MKRNWAFYPFLCSWFLYSVSILICFHIPFALRIPLTFILVQTCWQWTLAAFNVWNVFISLLFLSYILNGYRILGWLFSFSSFKILHHWLWLVYLLINRLLWCLILFTSRWCPLLAVAKFKIFFNLWFLAV